MRLAILGLLFTACSCLNIAQVETPKPTVHELDAVVKVIIDCGSSYWNGSGVIVSDSQALTAAHVVECPEHVRPKAVYVDAGDRVWQPARVEVLLPELDVARVKLEDPTFIPDHLVIGTRPDIGDKVCMANSAPRLGYHCGLIQPGRTKGMLVWDWMTEHGNSGAGVYNEKGELIGLLITVGTCEHDLPCIGGITPLQGYEWLVP